MPLDFRMGISMANNERAADVEGAQRSGDRRATDRRSTPSKMFDMGHYIFREGESGQEAFILNSGKVQIFRIEIEDGEAVEKSLAILPTGTMFGEMALIDDKPRMASARAYGGPAQVLVVDQQQFRKMLEPVNPFVKKLLSILADHVRDASNSAIASDAATDS